MTPCPAILQSARGAVQLRGRASELEAELAEQRHLKQQAQDESEFLRTELEELKKQREDTEKAQRSLTEIESERGGELVPSVGWLSLGVGFWVLTVVSVAGRAQANEQRYSKLKEKYSELVQNHADLLRKVGSPNPAPRCTLFLAMPPNTEHLELPLCCPQNAEVTKQVTVARQAQGDVEREKKELEDSFQRVSEQAQRKVSGDTGTRRGAEEGSPKGHQHQQSLCLPAVSGAGGGAGHAEAGAGSQQAGAAGPPGHPGVQHQGETPWVAPAPQDKHPG